MGLCEAKVAKRNAEKAGGALSYILIGAPEVRAKLAREAREVGTHRGKKAGARYCRRERSKTYK